MSTAVAIYHGRFGRASLYRLNRPMARHAHREGHLIFLISGARSSTLTDARRCPIDRTSGVAINPWEPHDFVPGDDEQGSLFLVLYINPAWFLAFEHGARSMLRFGDTQIEISPAVGRLVGRICMHLQEGAPASQFDGHLYELAHACLEQSWQRPRKHVPASSLPCFSDFRVRKSVRLLTERLGDDIELDQIAREAGLSRPHFYRLFKHQTGVTPNLYLNTLRMEKAIHRLSATSTPVAEIGLELGFSSQSSFSRFFAANVGMAPSDYRRVVHRLDA